MTTTINPNRLPDSSATNQLLLDCYEHMQAQKLVLPTIPEISYKIRHIINDSSASSYKISRVVQTDPAITARLIQIASSPFYCGRRKIESCPEALTRIGLRASQDIITSISIKSVFRAETDFIGRKMAALWDHSSTISAISAVIAHKIPGFDPDRAMLAGLIHDIGIVPILTYADRHQNILVDTNDLTDAVKQLRVDIGVQIVKAWGFPSDFEEVVTHSENWCRQTNEAINYADIVMIAQFLSYIGKMDVKRMPKIDTLPVYKKLAKFLDITDCIAILDTAKDDIKQIRQWLA